MIQLALVLKTLFDTVPHFRNGLPAANSIIYTKYHSNIHVRMNNQFVHKFERTSTRHLKTVDYKYDRMFCCQRLQHRCHRCSHTFLFISDLIEQNILISLTSSVLIIAAQDFPMKFIDPARFHKRIKTVGAIFAKHVADCFQKRIICPCQFPVSKLTRSKKNAILLRPITFYCFQIFN